MSRPRRRDEVASSGCRSSCTLTHRTVKLHQTTWLALAGLLAGASAAPAQTAEPKPADTRLFTHRDAIAAGLATFATFALAAFDQQIAESVSDPEGTFQRNRFLGARAENFNRVNEQTLTVGGLAL